MIDLLDLSLFNDKLFLNLAVGVVFVMYTDVTFFSLLPMYFFGLGMNKADTALLVSIGAIADMAGRIIISIISSCVQLKARTYFLIGTVATIIMRFVFLYMESFTGLAISIAALGLFRTCFHVMWTLVMAEHSEDRFAASYGLLLFFKGSFSFIISPFIGWVRDTTKSYVACFNTLTFITSLCAILWIIEILYVRLRISKTKSNLSV